MVCRETDTKLASCDDIVQRHYPGTVSMGIIQTAEVYYCLSLYWTVIHLYWSVYDYLAEQKRVSWSYQRILNLCSIAQHLLSVRSIFVEQHWQAVKPWHLRNWHQSYSLWIRFWIDECFDHLYFNACAVYWSGCFYVPIVPSGLALLHFGHHHVARFIATHRVDDGCFRSIPRYINKSWYPASDLGATEPFRSFICGMWSFEPLSIHGRQYTHAPLLVDVTQLLGVCPTWMRLRYYYTACNPGCFYRSRSDESQKALWRSSVLEDAAVASLQQDNMKANITTPLLT